MIWILLFLLILVVFGFGFTLQMLWWVAAVLLVVWLAGFAMRGRGGGRRGGGSRRYGRSRR
ncbi:hydrophobic protein [Streptomyces sp. NPDC051954]|uniref:hydrophobic protein n=1 Tax=unclassified Streptomyces TaxID=2593676 RepID=UPI003435F7DE